jgi:hypothetical protein
MNNNNTVADPSLKDLLDLLTKNIFLNLNCHAIGTVRLFNPLNQTATITINYKKTYSKPSSVLPFPDYVDYPVLLDVPIIVLGDGKSSHLTFPIKSGATCMVLFNDRDLDNWFASGQVGPVATPRAHSMSDGVAIVGLNSLLGSILLYDAFRTVLTDGDFKVAFGAPLGVGTPKARFMNTTETVGVEIDSVSAKMVTPAVTIKAGVQAEISNATFTLGALLAELVADVQQLATATAAIVSIPCVIGAPVTLNPASIAAVNAASAAMAATAVKIAGLLA